MRSLVTVSQVCSVSRPIAFICASAQRTDAPIPRLGSVCDDSVWRVPKLTSFSTVARIFAASTLPAIAPTLASGVEGCWAVAVAESSAADATRSFFMGRSDEPESSGLASAGRTGQ